MKKHITEITNEWKGFWQPLFDKLGIPHPNFYAKLGYMASEFGEQREPGLRFFPSELALGKDLYVELFDWEQDFYHGAERILYKLPFNPNWETEYIKVFGANIISYAVQLSKLEVVNKSLSTAAYPNLETIEELPIFDGILDDSSEKDQHLSSMTMKDLYCIIHNVAKSDKKWLNDLIKSEI